jgi:hypothetical protein
MIHWMEFGVKKQRSAQWESDLVRLEELGSRPAAGSPADDEPVRLALSVDL